MQYRQWTAGNTLEFPFSSIKGLRKFNPVGYPNGWRAGFFYVDNLPQLNGIKAKKKLRVNCQVR
jgi:hypothetical protein